MFISQKDLEKAEFPHLFHCRGKILNVSFVIRIQFFYPKMDEIKIKKLTMENARYLISIFTPSTNMIYTTNLRQINYIIHWCEDYIKMEKDTEFTLKVKLVLKEFIEKMKFLYVLELNTEQKHRKLSLFDTKKDHREEWGETYCTMYLGSFAQLAFKKFQTLRKQRD